MLRRAAFLLLRGRAAWLPRQPVTAAATLVRRHPEPESGLRAVDGRGYARMARRMPPTRPDGYSTSDGEADAYGDVEDPEPAAGADVEEHAAEDEDWDGFTLDLGAGSIEDDEDGEDEDEEGEK